MSISKIIFYDYVLAYFPARVRFLLYEKDISFDHSLVDVFNAQNLTPQFAKLNPAMTLPVMNLDGRIITQSMDICEALEGYGTKLGVECDPEVVKKHVDLIKDWDGILSLLI
jgi:hypothetical protein